MFNRLYTENEQHSQAGKDFEKFIKEVIWPQIESYLRENNISPNDASLMLVDAFRGNCIFYKTFMWLAEKK